jgi:hypothetical protein
MRYSAMSATHAASVATPVATTSEIAVAHGEQIGSYGADWGFLSYAV